jgi:hypothetical protein
MIKLFGCIILTKKDSKYFEIHIIPKPIKYPKLNLKMSDLETKKLKGVD